MKKNLIKLARLHGIQTVYNDVFGKRHAASVETLFRVLKSLGVGVKTGEDISVTIEETLSAKLNRVIEPVTVAWDGKCVLVLVIPKTGYPQSITFTLTTEDGLESEWTENQSMEDDFHYDPENDFGFVVTALPLPKILPSGYYKLAVEISGAQHTSLVISAPPKAYSGENPAKNWGVFLPLYAFHTDRDSIGSSFSDLSKIGDWCGEFGGEVVGTLPLLCGFFSDPVEPSPYSPATRLFWNELYLDIDRIRDLISCPRAIAILESEDFRRDVQLIQSSDLIDYKRLMTVKRIVLEEFAGSFFASPDSHLRNDFNRFVTQHPNIAEYARFRAKLEKSGTVGSDKENEKYHLFVQWLSFRQMTDLAHRFEDLGYELYLDLPLGVHPAGYDALKGGDLFAQDISVGAPPDSFFPTGQNWGFPPMHPEKVRDAGYEYPISYIRHHLQFADMLRIDHVMGIHRLFWIPAGMSPADGVYVRYHHDEWYAMLCLESHRYKTKIVGEDLGTVPGYVRKAMKRHNFSSLYVLQCELSSDPAAPLNPVPSNAVASFNTHDMPTFSAFWQGLDIQDRLKMGLLDESQALSETENRRRMKRNLIEYLRKQKLIFSEVVDNYSLLKACIAHLGSSNAKTVMVNIEDLWQELRPQNVPGTSTERPNWRRKTALTFDEFSVKPEVVDHLKTLESNRKRIPPDTADNNVKRVRKHPILTQDDIFLFHEGKHFRLHEKMGAVRSVFKGLDGTHFAVWAPNAEKVSVVGDFNGWNEDAHPLRKTIGSGIWEGFIPGVGQGQLYKYHIKSRKNDYTVDKADPFGILCEPSPRTASVVWNLEHEWNDGNWLAERRTINSLDAPMSIYELHIGSWRRIPEDDNRPLSYRELAPLLADYVHKMGFTHVEFLPVMEHPFYGSWGYQVTGFYAPTSRYGTPQDFMYLIDYLHQRGIGVILDWVPSHYPIDQHGLRFFDGSHLFEHEDPRRGIHPDWGSSIFNLERPEVHSFLISNALFWLDKYHIDGLRVDAVASMLYLDYSRKAGQWIPNKYGGRENLAAIDFLRHLNEAIYSYYPDVQVIAEESTSWDKVSHPTTHGGLGFGMKWDMGWMHDTLSFMSESVEGSDSRHDKLTFRQLYALSENFVLPLSHDEVVYGKGSLLNKMPGSTSQKFARLKLLFGYQYAQNGKKLLFMGGEFGQQREWNHDVSLDWHLLDDPLHAGLQRWVSDLNRFYKTTPAMYTNDFSNAGFEWIDCEDYENGVLSLMRIGKDPGDVVIVVINLSSSPRDNYRVGCPADRTWRMTLNSNAERYGGTDSTEPGPITPDQTPWQYRPYSISLTLPPLSVQFLV